VPSRKAATTRAEDLHAKRSLSLSETLSGMFRIDGYLDPIAGAALRDAMAGLTGRTGRNDKRSIHQRRADALLDLVTAGMANKNPLGISQVSVLVELEDLSSDGAVLDDGSVLGTRMLDLLTCTAIVSVILGTRRNNVLRPPRPGPRKRTVGVAMALPDRPRPWLHPLRTRPPILPGPPHPPLAPRRHNRPGQHGPALLQPATTTCTTATTPSP
jgi:hypothetical protein